MGANSKIGWTDHTFNPWWGCEKLPGRRGCENCYAAATSHRYGHDCWGDSPRKIRGPGAYAEPLKWNRSAEAAGRRDKVFLQSMGDFLEDHPDLVQPRRDTVRLIEDTPNLTWLILTKRPENFRPLLAPLWSERWGSGGWPANVWVGCTVETQANVGQLAHLLRVPAARRFVSAEPLLTPIDFRKVDLLDGRSVGPAKPSSADSHPLDWLIIGCESGPNRRPCPLEWVDYTAAWAIAHGVPLFIKQLSVGGRVSKDPAEWPAPLRMQEFPSDEPQRD